MGDTPYWEKISKSDADDIIYWAESFTTTGEDLRKFIKLRAIIALIPDDVWNAAEAKARLTLND